MKKKQLLHLKTQEEIWNMLKYVHVYIMFSDTCIIVILIQLLQKKFEDFKADLNRSKDRITLLNSMGQALLTANHSSSVEINKQLRLTNKLWEILQNKTFTRDKILAAAKEIHVFNRDAFEAKGRILVIMCTIKYICVILHYDYENYK